MRAARADPRPRPQILRELLEARVFEDSYIRQVSELEFEGVDPHGGPIGSDSEGYYYYHDGGKSCRIYREKPRKAQKAHAGRAPDAPLSWDTITTCLDEIEALLKYHQKSRKVADRRLCAHLEEHIIPPLRAARDAEERREVREENRLKRKAEMEERRKVWDAMPKKRSSRLERLEMERRAQEDERERVEEERRRAAEERRIMLEEKSEQAPLLVDRRVRVLWEEDNTWYCGLVTAYDRSTGEHTLFYYDDSSSERLDLWASDVKWEHDTTPLPAEYAANEANALPSEEGASPARRGGASPAARAGAGAEAQGEAQGPPRAPAPAAGESDSAEGRHERKRRRAEDGAEPAGGAGARAGGAGCAHPASHWSQSETKPVPRSASQSALDRIPPGGSTADHSPSAAACGAPPADAPARAEGADSGASAGRAVVGAGADAPPQKVPSGPPPLSNGACEAGGAAAASAAHLSSNCDQDGAHGQGQGM